MSNIVLSVERANKLTIIVKQTLVLLPTFCGSMAAIYQIVWGSPRALIFGQFSFKSV